MGLRVTPLQQGPRLWAGSGKKKLMNAGPFSSRLLAVLVPLVSLAARERAFSFTLTEALDDPALVWESSAEWTGEADTGSHDGVDAARAVAGSGGSEHRLATTVTGPGVLSLWWSVPQPNDEGYIAFEVDGATVIRQWLGFGGWEQLSVNVPAGQHKVTVVVQPSGSVTTLVDQASWSPGQRLPAAVAVGDADGFWV